MATPDDLTNVQVDVGILKTQVTTITTLCNKMDQVIEKLVEQHDRHIAKVYDDIDKRRLETDMDIKDIHGRIDTVLDKVQHTEKTLLDEIKGLRAEMQAHNAKEKEKLQQLLDWKWMIVGGIIVVTWLLSHVGPDILLGNIK
jgi:NurA-like 5'-3' nuclease